MGLFKSLKKAVMKVVKGVQKRFKKVGEIIGKVLNSGIGKILMIALTVITLGTALIAGYAAFGAGMAAGQGFVSAMISGGKAFMVSLTGMGAKEGAEAGASVGAGAGMSAAEAKAAEAMGHSAEAIGGEFAAKTAGTVTTAGKVAEAVPSVSSKVGATVTSTTKGTGFLSKAGDVVKGIGAFAKDNPGLLNLAGNMVSGFAKGKAAEEIEAKRRKEITRFEDLWADYDIEALQKNIKPSNVVPIHSGSFKAFKDKATTGVLTQQEQAEIREAGQGRVRLDREALLESGG